jgi:hypothetical protein
MANQLQQAGAMGEPSNFAPLHTNRIFTGLWTNRNLLRDAATTDYQEQYGMGRQDSILGGFNSEICTRLSLVRRPGTTIYNSRTFPAISRWYSFNTFTIASEVIRVMADTAATVYDATGPATQTTIFTKSPGAGSTYFQGVGNNLYFSNGVDNKQVSYNPTTGVWGPVGNWGIQPPATAPTITQAPRVSPYPQWQPNAFYGYPLYDANANEHYAIVVIIQTQNGTTMLYQTEGGGTTGATQPEMNPAGGTIDGTIAWEIAGEPNWQSGYSFYDVGSVVTATVNGMLNTFLCTAGSGNSGLTAPYWPASGSVQDAGLTWLNIGLTAVWGTPSPNQPSIGPHRVIPSTAIILDPNGYVEQIVYPGVSGTTAPTWQTLAGAFTIDGTATWINVSPYAVAATAPSQYGYAYENSLNTDLSNMSPPSVQITQIEGNEVIVKGVGSADPSVNTIFLYRTPQGGSTYLFLASFPNPGAGVTWTYTDTIPDSGLNPLIQAQVLGEGTPLPSGATCLSYYMGRTIAAVGNVVWMSSGPDAIVAGSSGNAGFDIQFTAQSKITRFWPCSLGLVVFTVRDAYIILGSGTSSNPFYMTSFIDDLPLRSYDCFTVNKTTPFLMMGNNVIVTLDPSAGITELSLPIADLIEEQFNSAASYVTYLSQSSFDNALFVASGTGYWYRMAVTSAPETGTNWSVKAQIPWMGAVQAVEVLPGQFRLLMSNTQTGTICQRDRTVNTDLGVPFACQTTFGNIVLAQPGQLAALTFITLESLAVGTRPGLALLLGEIFATFDAGFEPLLRTRQDPTLLPPSKSLYSDRYNFSQNQKAAWCRHFQMQINWAAEDAPNELLTFTIFGQTWNEFRTQ